MRLFADRIQNSFAKVHNQGIRHLRFEELEFQDNCETVSRDERWRTAEVCAEYFREL